jgi:PAS domain S-box-containing protein
MRASKDAGHHIGFTRPAADQTAPPAPDGEPSVGTSPESGAGLSFIDLFGESSFEWLSAIYRSIVDTSPEALTVLDPEGKVRFCNRQAAVLHGFEHTGQMVGRDAWDFVAPEDLNRAVEDFKLLQSLGAIHGVEYTLLRADGKRTPVELSASTIRDKEGNARALIGLLRDVSERRQSEEALRRSEEYFRGLIENAPDLITVIEASGNITYQSPSVERALGYGPEELVGTNIWSFVHPDDAPTVGDAVMRGLLNPSLFELVVFRVRHKNGSWRYLEGSGKLLMDEQQRSHGVLNSRDVTDRVIAEQALEESERRKAAILSTAIDAVITIDHTSTILEFNPAAEAMFGYTAAEVIGKPMDELIVPPSLRARHRRGMKRYVAGGEGPILGQRVELMAMRADGTEFPAELAIVPIHVEGPPLFTGHVRDLSERQRWEDELQSAREDLDRKSTRTSDADNGYALTDRELAVLHLVARGKADKEIAVTLGISSQTVNKHVAKILYKMGASSRTEAGVRAIRAQIVE